MQQNKKLNYAIAITGGIGTGKSSVCKIIKNFGYLIIDADNIARESLILLKDEIVNNFGDFVLEKNEINRKLLGDIIFNNKDKKKILENILHPIIRDKIYSKANELEHDKKTYFIDIPLFFEVNKKKITYNIDTSLLVYSPKNMQITRIMNRDKLSYKDALIRIESQIDIEIKKKMATFIVNNIYSKQYLQKEVEKFISKL